MFGLASGSGMPGLSRWPADRQNVPVKMDLGVIDASQVDDDTVLRLGLVEVDVRRPDFPPAGSCDSRRSAVDRPHRLMMASHF